MFIGLARNGDADPSLSQSLAKLAAAVSLVCRQPFWTTFRAASAEAFDATLVEQGLCDGGFMLRSRGQDERDEVAFPIDPDMDFGAEPALAAP